MASGPAIPVGLRSADIQRFAIRANQLQKFRPIVTYWCEYYILQQILSKKLHTANSECRDYALQLMDKLETFKQGSLSNDAIVDDVAAKAYVENFAMETFDRADQAQRNNTVTRQTADTFQAAATFFDLLSIWGEADSERAAKSKFAKYHALRIAKAIKAGEDPNDTNPIIEPPVQAEEDGIEAELAALEQQTPQPSYNHQQPYVESEPPDTDQANQLPHETISPSAPEELNGNKLSHFASDDPIISPLSASESERTQQVSSQDAYFPTVVADHVPDRALPTGQDLSISLESPSVVLPTPEGKMDMRARSEAVAQPSFPLQSPQSSNVPSATTVAVPAMSTRVTRNPAEFEGYRTDEGSVEDAQKHTKWALAALNHDDVDLAVKYLRLALTNLGAK